MSLKKLIEGNIHDDQGDNNNKGDDNEDNNEFCNAEKKNPHFYLSFSFLLLYFFFLK